MLKNFWKAAAISAAASGMALLLGFGAGLPFALFLVPILQLVWAVFCLVRIVELRRGGVKDPDRDSYGFALGGSVSSLVLVLALVVASQVV